MDTTPDAHLTRSAGAAMDSLTDDGDENQAGPGAPSTYRSFRAPSGMVDAAGDVALSDSAEARAAAHLTRGRPDARRTDQAPSGHPSAPETPWESPETRLNVRTDVVGGIASPPQRPRQGFTGADPARPARFQVATLLRRFDQWARQHPGPVEKIGEDAPTAARPPVRARLAGARPNAAGIEGGGMTPIGGQRNTFRIVPGPWDERVVDDGSRVVDASAGRRARGWRL